MRTMKAIDRAETHGQIGETHMPGPWCLSRGICQSLAVLARLEWNSRSEGDSLRLSTVAWAWSQDPRTISFSVSRSPCPQRVTLRMSAGPNHSSEGSMRSLPESSWPQAWLVWLEAQLFTKCVIVWKAENVECSWVDHAWKEESQILSWETHFGSRTQRITRNIFWIWKL